MKAATALQRSLKGLAHFDRAGLRPATGVRLAAGVAVPLAVGVAAGHTIPGIEVATGALLAGIADPGGERVRAMWIMLAASGLSAVGTFGGALAARHEATVIAGAAVWSFLCGLLVGRSRAAGSIGLVATLAFLLVTERPLDLGDALETGAWILAGGALQSLQRAVAWPPDREQVPTMLFLRGSTAAIRRGLLMAIAMGVAVASYRLPSAGGHAYWVATTALFILRPGFGSVVDSALARYLGTVVAVGGVTAVTAAVAPSAAVLVVLAGVATVAAYIVLEVSFVLFTASISSLLILLAALVGLPPSSAAVDYMLDATLGALIAMLSYGLLATGVFGGRMKVQRAPDS